MNKDVAKLFENMKMLNPEFNLNEDQTFTNTFDQANSQQPTTGQPQATPAQQPVNQPADVKYLNNVQTKATQVTKAGSKINTTTEFSGAFKNWFSTLGYTPEGNVVTISRVLIFVKQALTELGYK